MKTLFSATLRLSDGELHTETDELENDVTKIIAACSRMVVMAVNSGSQSKLTLSDERGVIFEMSTPERREHLKDISQTT